MSISRIFQLYMRHNLSKMEYKWHQMNLRISITLIIMLLINDQSVVRCKSFLDQKQSSNIYNNYHQKWTPLANLNVSQLLHASLTSNESRETNMKASESVLKSLGKKNQFVSQQQRQQRSQQQLFGASSSVEPQVISAEMNFKVRHNRSKNKSPLSTIHSTNSGQSHQAIASPLNEMVTPHFDLIPSAPKPKVNMLDKSGVSYNDEDNDNEMVKSVDEILHSKESVLSKSAMIPPRNRARLRPSIKPPNDDYSITELPKQQRNEQETAETNETEAEAEAVDKLALDEQQQQQREIILAQAESEAKAIKEQQEALLRQQILQEQMLMRRQNDLARKQSDIVNSQRLQQMETPGATQRPATNQLDTLFSDQPDSQENFNFAQTSHDDETMSDHLVRHPSIGPLKFVDSAGQVDTIFRDNDLVPAAQHHYGSNYDSLHDHHKDYYQYTESHKKGQFDSGFKRGGKKFQISGHSSQHKNHAEGHVKWNGRKGKGVQYWDYKHKNHKHPHNY